MNRNEAFALSINTKVRAKLYIDGHWSHGTIVTSSRYGKGVRFNDYRYLGGWDCHGFGDISVRLLESLEMLPKNNEKES